jgi:hypothetical protein
MNYPRALALGVRGACLKRPEVSHRRAYNIPMAEQKRRYHRFKDFFRGSMEYQGSSYFCVVEEISQRGLRLLSAAAVNIGDRMRVDLHISQDTRLSCVIEVRQFIGDALGAEIVDIAEADANVLRGLIEGHYSAAQREGGLH